MAIISHDHRFIFVHIPKTAGTSITRALLSQEVPLYRKAIRKLTHLHTRLLPGPASPRLSQPPIPKHAKAKDIKKMVGRKIWNSYFTFAIVRNPWDLMVSSYHWWLQHAEIWEKLQPYHEAVRAMDGFDRFIRSDLGRERINEARGDIFDWLTDEDGGIIVDYVARYEQLQDEYNKICQITGIPPVSLPQTNTTRRSDYRDYYDDQSQKLVQERFHRTIKQFGYSF